MNLGAFMDPEYPIFSTTLCYLERDDAYLMLHRIKKQDDYNHDKWVGVGGKFERFESPEDCLVREVREETGLTLTRWRCRGLLTFVWGNMTTCTPLTAGRARWCRATPAKRVCWSGCPRKR